MKIIAIDPANEESAFVIMDGYSPYAFEKTDNYQVLRTLDVWKNKDCKLVIEMVASYGMPVGKEVFETCVWIGRFLERFGSAELVYRKDVKMNLCGTMRAKDSNVRQTLIDRFGVVGTKDNQGFFYGFKADIWQAYAVGVTYLDSHK